MSARSAAGTAAAGSTHLRTLARGGYVASGALHLVIGWIAVRVALAPSSDGGESADQSGALAQINETSWGPAFLWFAVVALVALALVQIIAAVSGGAAGRDASDTGDRVKSAAKAVTYLALAGLTVSVVTGSSGGSGGGALTAELLTSTAGKALVAAVGLGIAVVGGYHVYKGVTKKFEEDLTGGPGGQLGRGVVLAGMTGYAAKGAALIIMGGLFVVAAVTADPEKASGLDAALRSLADAPFGKVLLTLVGLGFVAFGVYSFARARYARM